MCAACLYPLVLKYLPILLPGHFNQLLVHAEKKDPLTVHAVPDGLNEQDKDTEVEDKEEKDTSLLAKLEEIIAHDVWKLGFSTVSVGFINTIFPKCVSVGKLRAGWTATHRSESETISSFIFSLPPFIWGGRNSF